MLQEASWCLRQQKGVSMRTVRLPVLIRGPGAGRSEAAFPEGRGVVFLTFSFLFGFLASGGGWVWALSRTGARFGACSGAHLPTCFCCLCHELWQRMTCCRFCLSTNKKHGHKGCGLTKEASYFQRHHISWYPAILRHIAHGLDATEAKRQVDMERRVQEGRQKTAAILEKLNRQRDEEEKHKSFSIDALRKHCRKQSWRLRRTGKKRLG